MVSSSIPDREENDRFLTSLSGPTSAPSQLIGQPMQPTLKKEGKNTVLKKPFSMRVRQSCVLTLSSTQSTLKRERAEKGGPRDRAKRDRPEHQGPGPGHRTRGAGKAAKPGQLSPRLVRPIVIAPGIVSWGPGFVSLVLLQLRLWSSTRNQGRHQFNLHANNLPNVAQDARRSTT